MTKRHVRRDDDAPLHWRDVEALEWIFQYLTSPSHHHEIQMCREYLSAGMCDRFDPTWTTWKHLPWHFVERTLLDICGFQEDTLRLLNQSGELRRVWIHVFGVSSNACWPFHLHRHDILKQFLTEQLERMGRRHERILTHMDTQGKVDWDRAMPYKLLWTRNKEGGCIVDSLEHLSGATVKVAKYNIRCPNTVECPWDDLRAHFDCTHRVLALFFDDRDALFRTFIDGRFFEDEACRLETIMSQRETRGTSPPPIPKAMPKRKRVTEQ